MIQTRRRFIAGAAALLCAPAIVRAGSIMAVKALPYPGCIPQDDEGFVFSGFYSVIPNMQVDSLIMYRFRPIELQMRIESMAGLISGTLL